MNNCEYFAQSQKADSFSSMHEHKRLLVIGNAWDAGSAKVLTSLNFDALATTSAGLALSLGRRDGEGLLSRDESLFNASAIAAATHLPVTADLENCYGIDPDECAETILLASRTGVVGGSIEDSTNNSADPIFSLEKALERVKAAVEAAKSLPFKFTLTARAENLFHGRNDLKDTLRRLEAYADAGADVLFAPGFNTRQEVEAAVKAVFPLPLNVMMGMPNSNFTLSMLEDMGVKRVSFGASFLRISYNAVQNAAFQALRKETSL